MPRIALATTILKAPLPGPTLLDADLGHQVHCPNSPKLSRSGMRGRLISVIYYACVTREKIRRFLCPDDRSVVLGFFVPGRTAGELAAAMRLFFPVNLRFRLSDR